VLCTSVGKPPSFLSNSIDRKRRVFFFEPLLFSSLPCSYLFFSSYEIPYPAGVFGAVEAHSLPQITTPSDLGEYPVRLLHPFFLAFFTFGTPLHVPSLVEFLAGTEIFPPIPLGAFCLLLHSALFLPGSAAPFLPPRPDTQLLEIVYFSYSPGFRPPRVALSFVSDELISFSAFPLLDPALISILKDHSIFRVLGSIHTPRGGPGKTKVVLLSCFPPCRAAFFLWNVAEKFFNALGFSFSSLPLFCVRNFRAQILSLGRKGKGSGPSPLQGFFSGFFRVESRICVPPTPLFVVVTPPFRRIDGFWSKTHTSQ